MIWKNNRISSNEVNTFYHAISLGQKQEQNCLEGIFFLPHQNEAKHQACNDLASIHEPTLDESADSIG